MIVIRLFIIRALVLIHFCSALRHFFNNGIDRANGLTNEKMSVSVRFKTKIASGGHDLGPRDRASWGRQ